MKPAQAYKSLQSAGLTSYELQGPRQTAIYTASRYSTIKLREKYRLNLMVNLAENLKISMFNAVRQVTKYT